MTEPIDHQVLVQDREGSWHIVSHCGASLNAAQREEEAWRRRGYPTRIVTERTDHDARA